jgi:hypothetical protein
VLELSGRRACLNFMGVETQLLCLPAHTIFTTPTELSQLLLAV